MRKMLFCFAVLCLSFSLVSQDQDALLKFIPADVDGFGLVDIKGMLNNPKVKDLIQSGEKSNPELVDFKNDLNAMGIDLYTAFSSGAVFFNVDSKKTGSILKTSIKENDLVKIMEKNDKDKNKLQKVAHGKRTIYVHNGQGNSLSLAYLNADTIAFSQSTEDVIKILSVEGSQNVLSNKELMDLSSKADKKSLAWFVFKADSKALKKNKTEAGTGTEDAEAKMFPVDNIKGGIFTMNFSGLNSETVDLNLALNCKDKAKTPILTFQMQAMVMMAVGMMSQSNPQLSQELAKAIKFSNQENDILINVSISPALQDELKKFSEQSIKSDFSTDPMGQPTNIGKRPGKVKKNKAPVAEDDAVSEDVNIPATPKLE